MGNINSISSSGIFAPLLEKMIIYIESATLRHRYFSFNKYRAIELDHLNLLKNHNNLLYL